LDNSDAGLRQHSPARVVGKQREPSAAMPAISMAWHDVPHEMHRTPPFLPNRQNEMHEMHDVSCFEVHFMHQLSRNEPSWVG
jgi:hypothetical protein